MSAPELFEWAGMGHKTGTLTLVSGSITRKIVFQRGRLVSSASNDPRFYLGEFLVRQGYITREEHEKALELQNDLNTFLGKILVEIGAIGESDLMTLMRLKAEEEVYDVFLWDDGEFTFSTDEMPSMELIPLRIDVQRIVLEGSRRADDRSRERQPERSTEEFEASFDQAMDILSGTPVIAEETRIVGDRKAMRYHLAGCDQVPHIKRKQVVELSSEADARNAGYEACPDCLG